MTLLPYVTLMHTFFIVLLVITMAAVLGVLFTGLVGMGHEQFNAKYGNRLMQARVMLQGLAILFFAAVMLTG